jgi:lysophospholipase L1-like esterase
VTAKPFLALGDSYTIGVGVDPEHRWPSQLAAALASCGIEIEPRVIARNGWSTDELEAALLAEELDGRFDLVSLQIGVNDQYRGRPVESFQHGFTQLLEHACRLAGGPQRVFVVSIPDWGVTPFASKRDPVAIAEAIDRYNQAARELARARGAAWVDVTDISRAPDDPTLLAPDGLHPSPSQYASWVKRIAPIAVAALAGDGVRSATNPTADS